MTLSSKTSVTYLASFLEGRGVAWSYIAVISLVPRL